MEHRRGDIKRYKPRYNVEVNDYWMCDYGRSTHERYKKHAAPDRAARRAGPQARERQRSFACHRHQLEGRAGHHPAPAPDGRGAGRDRVPRLRLPHLRGGLPVRQAGRRARLGAPLGAGRRRPRVDDPPLPAAADHGPRAGPEPPRRGAGGPCRRRRQGSHGRRPAARRRRRALLGADRLRQRLRQGAPTTPRRSRGCARRSSWSSSAGPTRRWPRPRTSPCRSPITARRTAPSSTSSGGCSASSAPSRRRARSRSAVEALADLLSRFDAGWANLSTGAVFDRLAGELPAFAGLHLARPAGHRRGAATCRRRIPSHVGSGRRGGLGGLLVTPRSDRDPDQVRRDVRRLHQRRADHGLGRAAGLRLHPGPPRPEPRRAARPLPAAGGRREVHVQGRRHPGRGRQAALPAGAGAGADAGLHHLRGDPLRAGHHRGRADDPAGGGQRRHRRAALPRPLQPRRLLAGDGRLRLEQQVLAARLDPRLGAADQLRAGADASRCWRC